jgi:hypothetical protein
VRNVFEVLGMHGMFGMRMYFQPGSRRLTDLSDDVSGTRLTKECGSGVLVDDVIE